MKQVPAHIVVVDDEVAVAERVRGWLESNSIRVETFASVSAWRAADIRTPIDVALIDLHMPGDEGLALVRELSAASPAIQTIALTAFPTRERIAMVQAAGAATWVEKPLSKATVIHAVEQALAQVGVGARNEREFNRALGQRLRDTRVGQGRAQREVAKLAGITPAQLSQIESGKTATSTWTLARLCCALRIPPADLLRNL